MSDDLDLHLELAALATLAAEAPRLEPRTVNVSTRTSEDYKAVLIFETAGLTTVEVGALADKRKAVRRREDLAAAFPLVNSTGGVFGKKPDIPKGWPPE